MKKIKKLTRRQKVLSIAGVASGFSLIFLTACGGVGSDVTSSKKDPSGNPLAWSVKTPNGSENNENMDKFIDSITEKPSTQSQLFSSFQSALFEYLYNDEQKYSVNWANEYGQKKILQLETYSERYDTAKKAIEDEKKSYQETYLSEWESYWENHLISTYNTTSETQAIKNKTADTIKSDALRRYTLETTNSKAPDVFYNYNDIASFNTKTDPFTKQTIKPFLVDNNKFSNVYYRGIENSNAPINNPSMTVLQTKSFDWNVKNPEKLVDYYTANNQPLFVSHFLTALKPSASTGTPWTVTTDTLRKLFSTNSSDKYILSGLESDGLDVGNKPALANLPSRQKLLEIYSDNSGEGSASDKYNYGVIGNILMENINKTSTKDGFALGLTYGLQEITKQGGWNNLNSVSDIGYDFGTGKGGLQKGLTNILLYAIYNALGSSDTSDTDPANLPKLNTSIINGLTNAQLQEIGGVLEGTFNKANFVPGASASGRLLAYKTIDNDDLVLVSDDGIDFVEVNPLESADPIPNKTSASEYENFFDNPDHLVSRIRYDLKQGINVSKKLFDVANMVTTATNSGGNMQYYYITDNIGTSDKPINNNDFINWIKEQKKFDGSNFNDSDLTKIRNIISSTNEANLVPKNGQIYKWISDYYDKNSSDPNNIILNSENFNVDDLYKTIIKLEKQAPVIPNS